MQGRASSLGTRGLGLGDLGTVEERVDHPRAAPVPESENLE